MRSTLAKGRRHIRGRGPRKRRWLERIFLAPKNVNYHIEHHFFPSVPFYRLPELHAILMSKPGYREGAHVTRTYWGVLEESVGRTPSRRASVRAEGGSNIKPHPASRGGNSLMS